MAIIMKGMHEMKIKLIDEAKQWYKFASLWLNTAAGAIVSILTVFPDAAIQVWSIMPSEFKSSIPASYMPLIGVGVLVCGIIAVFIKQESIK